ncbi:LLM class flavin-dependent oxidoreductase [Chthonobacter rhizosphaerae]|uniref:LLM class flavin-dependent oxidoreductase n=1 Tax=Chthonobacter rhizosphaerae TaxID=2735553 RepID=UPI0015EEDD74|nr:LLM class flavin-dependent oxidoreductase [Chthonobacter rhizosphaerae]
MRLSVLDQSGVAAGVSPDKSIRETLALAKACETFGYHRFWVSEHHNTDGIAGSAPEVLLGALAASTRTIRIGSAGVMLPHYAPLKVAEQFRVLEALAPGRVDLGLGRGPGADRMTSYALKPDSMDNPIAMMSGMDSFPQAVEDVIAWAGGDGPDDAHTFHGIKAQPTGPSAPDCFIVGSTNFTAQLAAHFSLPYCFAHFFNDGVGAADAVDLYRRTFRPSQRRAEPYASLCVFALAAPTEDEADALFRPYALWRLDRDRGRTLPFPSVEMAAARALRPEEEGQVDRLRRLTLVGTPERVVANLKAVAEAHRLDEVVLFAPAYDPAVRTRSYRLIAEAAGLAPA